MISDVPSAAEVVRSLVAEAATASRQLQSFVGS
jgi:hypothetical protein